MTSNTDECSKHNFTVPDGYIIINGPDNQKFLVPEFMVPALQQNLDANQKKQDLDVFQAAGSVSKLFLYFTS